jgi:hypothetical protein
VKIKLISHSNFKEKYNMLWLELLQNTICCGTLHVTSYQLYESSGTGKRPPNPVAGISLSLPQQNFNKEEV